MSRTTEPASSTEDKNAPEALSNLLSTGKFALYHLEKAKVAFARGDLAAAGYQVAASLAHDRLPDAVALKEQIKERSKAK